MPSTLRYNRKAIIYSLLAFILVCYLLFSDNSSSEQSFRTKTEAGLARARNQKGYKDTKTPLQENLSDEAQTKKANEKLQSILDAKNKVNHNDDDNLKMHDGEEYKTNEKESAVDDAIVVPPKPTAEKFQHHVEDVADAATIGEKQKITATFESSAHGATKVKMATLATATKDAGEKVKEKQSDNTADEDDPARDFARMKMMEYLKNPVVIFSKTYCPHSKRAKHLLLEVYSITPKPLVVELDQLGDKVPSSDRNLGQVMQDVLGTITGRKTVPNIMVGGIHSIGGNDKIWDLHEKGLLAEEIRKLGGRKVTEVDVVGED